MSVSPRHIAIIMDGNGRWATEKGLPRVRGHQAGVESIREVVRACGELGIRYLTLYAFSTENWARPKDEVNFLMNLLSEYLDRELKELSANDVKLRVIGKMGDLPDEVQQKIGRNLDATRNNTGLVLTLALSYSSRVEIVDAARRIAEKVSGAAMRLEDITPETFAQHLYTAGIPDPDLLIRTSGELRISNFLLWQLSYTEIYVTEKLWPDFRKEDLQEAIQEYTRRERRFGRTEVRNER
jgi:undecaprenyl diphosphate synthase